MSRIISVGIALWIIIDIFADIGSTLPEKVFTLGGAFNVLGFMIIWSLVTLMVYTDFRD